MSGNAVFLNSWTFSVSSEQPPMKGPYCPVWVQNFFRLQRLHSSREIRISLAVWPVPSFYQSRGCQYSTKISFRTFRTVARPIHKSRVKTLVTLIETQQRQKMPAQFCCHWCKSDGYGCVAVILQSITENLDPMPTVHGSIGSLWYSIAVAYGHSLKS